MTNKRSTRPGSIKLILKRLSESSGGKSETQKVGKSLYLF